MKCMCLIKFIQFLSKFTSINAKNFTTSDIRGKITKTRMLLAFKGNISWNIFSVVGVASLSSVLSKIVDNSF